MHGTIGTRKLAWWRRAWAWFADDRRAEWDRREAAGERPDPQDPGGPANNAW
jgi:hypothetical protein